MKNPMGILGVVFVTFVLVAGCDNKEPNSISSDQLTASELADLTGFHAWKISIPKSQQPVKAIQLVIINHRDGSVAQKFRTTDFSSSDNCSSILLGIHVEEGTFKGQLNTRFSNGGGAGWDLNFKDTLTDLFPAWSGSGALAIWNDNRINLATSTKSNVFDRVLAIQLVK